MSNSIKLSPKYGVNLSMCQCFFCGEVKGIALMGRINDASHHADIEAPKMMVMDYEPCDKCQEQFNQGVLCLELTTTQPKDKRPAITKHGGVDNYPTDKFLVLKEEAAQRIFSNPKLVAGSKCFLEEGLVDIITNSVNKQCE